ncbi:hypothetical protein CUJ83_07140 [Methanocella sp. CWC-04]|uniref:Uncharacterized protein n=1 Tax=Methanooceanicella nereidis TaxID=2052831 RepID=A0AAP2RCU9_9EURY|nr:hypothetical protein [Methanocella sp. CWC-04]MCD1294772.1 hypothetical protein [Methanocella sp. CWC-04]
MEITQVMLYAVIAIQAVLVLLSIYFYSSYKLRMFIFMGLGFLALLISSVIPLFLTGTDTGIYSLLLQAGAGLFFATGILTAV